MVLFAFLEIFCDSFFLEIIENEKYPYLYFTAIPLSGKILVCKLWVKKLLTNQIAEFLEV